MNIQTKSPATKHGVMYQTGNDGDFIRYIDLLTLENGKWIDTPLPEYPHQLREFCEVAEKYRLTHLWIMPGVSHAPDKTFFENASVEWDLFGSWTASNEFSDTIIEDFEDAPKVLVSATGYRRPKGGKHFFSVIFLENTQWTWRTETLPKRVLYTIKYMEDALQVPIGGGPTTAGIKLLERLHESRKDRLSKPGVDLRDLPFSNASHDLVWPSGGTVELHGTHLHKVDKNSAYLRSCVEEKMGVGSPVHQDGGEFNHLVPGVWLCDITGLDKLDSRLPYPLWDNYEWLSTPIVKMLIKLGCEVTVRESWTFPTSYKMLKDWAELLFSTRKSFKTDRQLWTHEPCALHAADGMKDIATKTVGLFGDTDVLDNPKNAWKYRPDYRSQAIGGTRALMHYNMAKYALDGNYPCMVYMDALFYCSNDPNPEIAIPGILDHKDSLGGYKHVWTLPITQVVRNILANGQGLGMQIGMLNRLAGEVEE